MDYYRSTTDTSIASMRYILFLILAPILLGEFFDSAFAGKDENFLSVFVDMELPTNSLECIGRIFY